MFLEIVKFISKHLGKCWKYQHISSFPFLKSPKNDSIEVKVFFIEDHLYHQGSQTNQLRPQSQSSCLVLT